MILISTTSSLSTHIDDNKNALLFGDDISSSINFPNSLEFDQNWWNLTKIDEIWPKLLKLDQNLWILPKVLTFTKIYEIWPKWIKLGKHWWILIKKVKITHNRLNSHIFWVTVIHNFLTESENVSRWPFFGEIKLRKC